MLRFSISGADRLGYNKNVSRLRNFVLLFTRIALGTALGVLVSLTAVPLIVHGQNAAISTAFSSTDNRIVQGALVSTAADDANKVELATMQTSKRITGVANKNALVKLSAGQEYDVQVTTGGAVNVLASDINGQIRAGDKITVSPINGVGMLATQDGQILGTALTAFNTDTARQQQITDTDNQQRTVRIGSVPVQLGIVYYTAPTSQLIPPFLSNIANTIAGRPVSLIRILLGLITISLAFLTVAVLVYTSVRAGIVSIGRNPLAAGAIRRGLWGAAGIAVLLMASALVLTYIILTF